MTGYDVAIVGYGPTGLTLASLLGQRGHRVIVLERWPTLYGMARLTHVDAETVRLLAFASDVDTAMRDSSPIFEYNFVNGKGQVLFDAGAIPTTPMGYPAHNSIFQPHIEDALDARTRENPNVTIRQGCEVIALDASQSPVRLTFKSKDGATETVDARFVFGSDGARSFVRDALGIGRKDFGFNERWLNIDCELKRPLPASVRQVIQFCDPARGHMCMPIGHTRQRFEFGLLPGEDTDQMATEANAWKMLRQYHDLGPDDVNIVRRLVYTFECRLAEQWHRGNVFIGGDAAHTMPPYLGQGACSGIRDAANIAWKLDLVLRGKAKPALLDTYQPERQPHVAYIMKTAVGFGKVANTHNRLAAFVRDLVFRLKLLSPPPPFPPIGDGVVQHKDKQPFAKMIGDILPHGNVEVAGDRDYFDNFVGYNFALVCRADALEQLSAEQFAFLNRLGCKIMHIGTTNIGGATAMADVEGIYGGILDTAKSCALLIRPDTVAFGFAEKPHDLAALVDELRGKLAWVEDTAH